MSPPNRIREYRHAFQGPRRIVATMRVHLDRVTLAIGRIGLIDCEWDGSSERQPSLALYPEFKQWAELSLGM